MKNSFDEINRRLSFLLEREGLPVSLCNLSSTSLTDFLIAGKKITPAKANSYLEEASGCRALDPTLVSFSTSFLEKMSKLIPRQVLEDMCAFPVKQSPTEVYFVLSNPFNKEGIRRLESWVGSNVKIYVCHSEAIRQCIGRYFDEDHLPLPEDLTLLLEESRKYISQQLNDEQTDITDLTLSPYVITVLRRFIQDAVNSGASDIHFEPQSECFRIRARLDGVLQVLFEVHPIFAGSILARIKMISDLSWQETHLPQDGRVGCNLIAGRSIDIRVSVLPTLYGEKAVLRILDNNRRQLSLAEFSLEDSQKELLRKTIRLPNGLVLVTGPTGCGKTTTLYSFLSELNNEHVNISTAEDPVEYALPGITQVNCNLKKGFSFATTLRALLRQDPDVLMVGEIRDFETADMAVKAASTGRLVFSTLHTNDAPGAIVRMINLGIPPFLIASCGLTVIAQRLIRVICSECKQPYQPDISILSALGCKKENINFFKGAGCSHCSYTGYKGREIIMEILCVSNEMAGMIMEQRPVGEIQQEAVKRGMNTLREEAMKKLYQEITTPEEVLRVTIEV